MLLVLVAVLAVPLGEYNLVEVEQAVAEMKLRLQSHHHHIHQNHLVASFFDFLLQKNLNYFHGVKTKKVYLQHSIFKNTYIGKISS